MSNLVEHAKREFEILGWPGDDEMQKLICDHVIELLECFSGHGHSGSSAPYALSLFNKLVKFDPISPLTGEDDEWNDIGDDTWQNRRNGTVFKTSAGAYWLDGKVFRDPEGCCYTNNNSRVPVEFPWTVPKSEIIDVC